MDIEDFEKYFDWMTICTMGPDFMKEGAATVDKQVQKIDVQSRYGQAPAPDS